MRPIAARPARIDEIRLVGDRHACRELPHHFGRGREGTPEVLQELCAGAGLSCTIVSAVEEHGAPVSSSAIRAALGQGDMATANELLGYRWFVAGEVRRIMSEQVA